jgi:DNA primase catalytic core
MSDVKELLDGYIYPNLDRADVVPRLNPKDKKNYFVVDCPACGAREAYLYKDGLYIKCNRLNECGYCISIWDYTQRLKGLTNRETLVELARLAGSTLPDLEGYCEQKAQNAREKADILETALNFFKKLLWMPNGNETLDYLKNRGYRAEEIEHMDLGFFPPQPELRAYLTGKGYSKETIESLGFWVNGLGKTHVLVIPYRDPVGRIKGFIVRTLKQDIKPKYLFTAGVSKDTLFNLHQARGQKTVIVTEGYLDALISTQREIKGTVAVGGACLTRAQIETAVRYGVKGFILALDNDPAGQDGTERSILLLQSKGMLVYVVKLPPEYKDPDEYIHDKGILAFKEQVEKAVSGARWMADRILRRYDLAADKGRRDALTDALEYEVKLKDPLDSQDVMETVTSGLNISLEKLEPQIAEYHQRKGQALLEQGYIDLFRNGERLLQKGDLTGLREFVEDTVKNLRVKAMSKSPTPYTFKHLQEEINQSNDGLRTGYRSLDSVIRIPQEAITIVAGRPSHGKTTFLMNLLLNMAELYPDLVFPFFSYEESRKQIGVKLINILSGEVIDEARNLSQIEAYLKGVGNFYISRLEQGKQAFTTLTESGRLWIIDESYFVNDLIDALAYLAETYPIGAVFIDYIQKIKIKGRYGIRQLELQKISGQILEAAKCFSLPVILGAQLGRDKDRANKVKLDNLRESGDIEQDANLVLGIYNESLEKAQQENEVLTDRVVDLKLTVLKNRNGAVNQTATLSFDRPILTIMDKDDPFGEGCTPSDNINTRLSRLDQRL